MATINSINCPIPIPVDGGGTGAASHTAYSPLAGGTTATGAVQSIGTGTANQIIVSAGAGSLPTWSSAALPTYFELLSADPASPAAGDSWYNTTTNLFKGYKLVAGTWTAKNSMITARRWLAGAATSSSDALSFAGYTTGIVTTTERFDGTNWTAKTAKNTGCITLGGSGSAADALAAGGQAPISTQITTTERYDGGANTWTAKTGLNTKRQTGASAGSADDTLYANGQTPGVTGTTERYDGGANTWTAKTNTNSPNYAGAATGGGGTAAAAIIFGGNGPSAVTEQYNGAGNSWTTKGSMNTGRLQLWGAGSATSALAFGGNGPSAVTERYNLTADAWTSVTSMNTARLTLAGGGTSTDALSFGGFTTVLVGTTEQYSGASIVTFTVT